MPDTLSANLNLLEQATGTASGAWGANLNTQVFDILDASLGGNQAVSLSSTNVTLTMTQRQHMAFTLSGVLTNNVALLLPLQTTATTLAVGGFFIVDNQTTGAFSVTVKTAASGSTGVEVPQGVHSLVYSDTTNVYFADDTQNQTQTVSGNPNGSVSGKAGSASTRASKIIDRATNIEYLCTTSGTASSAVWFPNLPFTFPCEGYLTAASSTDNPILTSDSIGATTIYYTAFNGGFFWAYNGTSFFPVPITGGQMALALSGSAQAANGIYDIIGFYDSGTPRVGFSPAWSVATAGSCSRGTGAGTPQMTRISGVPVNAVQQTVNNGSTTYTVAANRGTILGSIFIDSSAGQVTCHRSSGQNRKFGVWNIYNQQPIALQVVDSTSTWTYATATIRQSNGASGNRATPFVGLQQETIVGAFTQGVVCGSMPGAPASIGWGIDSTTAFSGSTALFENDSAPATASSGTSFNTSAASQLGISNWNLCEKGAGGASIFQGNTAMRGLVQWKG